MLPSPLEPMGSIAQSTRFHKAGASRLNRPTGAFVAARGLLDSPEQRGLYWLGGFLRSVRSPSAAVRFSSCPRRSSIQTRTSASLSWAVERAELQHSSDERPIGRRTRPGAVSGACCSHARIVMCGSGSRGSSTSAVRFAESPEGVVRAGSRWAAWPASRWSRRRAACNNRRWTSDRRSRDLLGGVTGRAGTAAAEYIGWHSAVRPVCHHATSPASQPQPYGCGSSGAPRGRADDSASGEGPVGSGSVAACC